VDKTYITIAIRAPFALDKKMNIAAFLTANGVVANQRRMADGYD
jgi:hypothetical protein